MTLELTHRLTEDQVLQLHRLYGGEWWSRDRRLEDVRRMLEHTDFLFAFCDTETGRVAAFARVLTDHTYKAFIFDVIVEPSFREQGLGRKLMEAIFGHPALREVKHLELYCLPELAPFYRKWGFTEDLDDVRLMRKTR
jgi:predicted GNAT family N-acyltransferase